MLPRWTRSTPQLAFLAVPLAFLAVPCPTLGKKASSGLAILRPRGSGFKDDR
jgi:hypothetical protein